MSGAFFVQRGMFERLDGLFANEPYSEREAWIWLFGNAVWKPTQVRVKNHMVKLERGQLAFSVRFLAEKWQWTKYHVEVFLNLLKKQDMIQTQPGRDITVITICNYDKYQLTPGYKPDTTSKKTRTQPGHNPDKEESLNNTNNKSISRATRSDGDDRGFDDFWKTYPKRSTASPKKPARLKYIAALKRGVTPEAILAGAAAYADEQSREGKIGTPYVKTPEVWLNQECWTAFEAPAQTGPPLPDDPIARRDAVWKQIEAENAAKSRAGNEGGDLLEGSGGVCKKEQPRMVCDNKEYSKTTRSMVKLFSGAPRLPACGDEDDGTRNDTGVPDARRMA